MYRLPTDNIVPLLFHCSSLFTGTAAILILGVEVCHPLPIALKLRHCGKDRGLIKYEKVQRAPPHIPLGSILPLPTKVNELGL